MSKKVLKIKYKIIQILTDKTYPIMTEIIITYLTDLFLGEQMGSSLQV